MDNPMPIRSVQIHELPIIQQLAHQIWPIAYRDMISKEQMDYMLEWMYSIPSLQQQVEEGHHFFLASDEANNSLGFSSFSLIASEPNSVPVYKLHKLYVHPHLHAKGIGKAMLMHIIAIVEKTSNGQLILNVNRSNKAVYFYQKMGFTILEEVDNEIGNGFYMNDFVMGKELNKAS
jgi:GNAT superfamily N-acetyltransferase